MANNLNFNTGWNLAILDIPRVAWSVLIKAGILIAAGVVLHMYTLLSHLVMTDRPQCPDHRRCPYMESILQGRLSLRGTVLWTCVGEGRGKEGQIPNTTTSQHV